MINKGKYFEEIVELIEKSIDSDTVIERDVKLPLLNTGGKFYTQCDLVIKKGEAPRESITIVEIQNRKSKPSSNDFRGWVEKLNNVGAQHLLCVSKAGFTKSTKEIARNQGNRIMLVELREIPNEQIPVNFFKFESNYQEFSIENFESMEFNFSPIDLDVYFLDENEFDLRGIKYSDKIFSYSKKEKVSLLDICADSVPYVKEDSTGKKTLQIDINTPFYFYWEKVFIGLSLKMTFNWKKVVYQIPIDLLSYEQDEHGTLIWLFHGSLETSNGQIDFTLPVKELDGAYWVSNYMATIPDGVKLDFKPYK
ncbi:MAG: hypothetical protein JJ971_10130 [Balneolaceae bacterium]|nr:hypothetical protein [Balneolaceae bacterium]MBO6546398.1 hypothetical protein [Balneolaceae bacterium]MBO6648757.1 hypothetical protein [Balneolaceae bacterium]